MVRLLWPTFLSVPLLGAGLIVLFSIYALWSEGLQIGFLMVLAIFLVITAYLQRLFRRALKDDGSLLSLAEDRTSTVSEWDVRTRMNWTWDVIVLTIASLCALAAVLSLPATQAAMWAAGILGALLFLSWLPNLLIILGLLRSRKSRVAEDHSNTPSV